MLTVPRLNLATFPDSPYAAELQRDGKALRFTPRIEAEYVRAHLLQNHTLTRVACILASILGLGRWIEEVSKTDPNAFLLLGIGLITCASILLASIACSAAFEHRYLRWAQVIIPARNACVAAHIAAAAAHGQMEMLMMLPLTVIGPFFFLGLCSRAALLSGGLTVISFAANAAFFAMPFATALRACALLTLFLLACAIAARHMEKWSRAAFLERNLIAELAQHDALTGTKNRRVFDEHLAQIWPHAIEQGRTIAILLIDVDHFKSYNDLYGHQAGDRTLRRIAQSVQAFVHHPSDVLARYGGEEFAAVLYDTDGERSLDIANRIRQAVEALGIEHSGSGACGNVTVSVGAAVVEPSRERNPRGALQLADQALYTAKIKGRNRVELMNDAEYRMLVTGVFSMDASRARA